MSEFIFENKDKLDLKDCAPNDQAAIISAVGSCHLEWANWSYKGKEFIKWMPCDNEQLSPTATYRVLAKPKTMQDIIDEAKIEIIGILTGINADGGDLSDAEDVFEKLAASMGGDK